MKKFSKKYILFSFLSFIISIIACNNSSESKLVYTENDTVKEIVNKKESEISWTKEIEPERLAIKRNSKDGYDSDRIILSPEIAKILKVHNEAEYPELPDFGKIDTSTMSFNLLEKLKSFCISLSEDVYMNIDSYFDTSYKFNYVFFKKDLIDGWQNNFKIDFPITEEKSTEIKNLKQTNEDTRNKINALKAKIEEAENSGNKKEDDTENKKEEMNITEIDVESLTAELNDLESSIKPVEEIKIFDRWIIGEAFIGDEIIEVPVRFYCQQGFIDITLYMNQRKQNSIYQITIDRWGKV